MSTEIERRAPGAIRIPFEALVEVGGAVGPAFEAQAMNVSEEGMLLRTAYLPDMGQPLTCRFDAGAGEPILASGEVVWINQNGKGGEFGIRFAELDSESGTTLRGLLGLDRIEGLAAAVVGSKVRLHIGGLSAPMRARIRDAHDHDVVVGSELGFLQVGKSLDMEDVESGKRRAARIDAVQVEVDPGSQVPQLVVRLRYDDLVSESEHEHAPMSLSNEDNAGPKPSEADDDIDAMALRSPAARVLSAAQDRLGSLSRRVATTAKLMWAERKVLRERKEEDAPRRQTSPAPNGVLQTAGRRVVRGESAVASEDVEAGWAPSLRTHRKKIALGGAVAIGVMMTAFAFAKPKDETPLGQIVMTELDKSASQFEAESKAALAAAAPPPVMMPAVAITASPSPAPAAEADPPSSSKPAKIAPFSNGPVKKGNVLAIKMDGPIASIQGAQQPTGFIVHVPGRKSTEAASALAQRDSRIATIKVTNDAKGAELSVTFKDGVPNYQVRARGDKLELVLATGKGQKKAAKKAKKHRKAKHTTE
jgi:hypothetical protein